MKYTILIVSFFCVTSCTIKGNLGGLFGYQKSVSKKAPNLIHKPKGDLCEVSNSDSAIVYAINGKELKNCIESAKRSMLYIWQPNCRSLLCIPPRNLQKICDSENIELFIVAEYYDYEKMMKKYEIKNPLLGVDTHFYKSNMTNKYLSKFLSDLFEKKMKYPDVSFFFFENGQLVAKNKNVFDINFKQ